MYLCIDTKQNIHMKQSIHCIFQFFLCIALLAVLNACPLRAAGTTEPAETDALPDSLITDDYVYEYTFSDFPLACRIMEQLRLRKKLPAHRLDLVEGDLYYNGGYNYRALKNYRSALESDSVRRNDEDYMDLLHRMITIYDALHNEQKKAEYVNLLMNKAQATGNHAMHAIALFNMGKMVYYEGNRNRGYELIYEAIDEMKGTDYKYKYDNLRYHYNTLLIMLQWDKRYNDALKTLKDLEAVVTRKQGDEPHMQGLDEKELKSLYAYRATFLYRLGRKKEAEENYQKFKALMKDSHRFNHLITPYLYDRKLYDEMISINAEREKFLIEQADTVNYLTTTVKRSLARAYEGKGDFRRAAAYYEQLSILRDSIKNREQRSAALELAAVYETAEKEALVQQQASKLRERNILLGSATGIVLLLCMVLGIMIHNSIIINRKNRIMARSISEEVDYKNQLNESRNIINELRKQIEAGKKEKATEKYAEVPAELQPEVRQPESERLRDIAEQPDDSEKDDASITWEEAENRAVFEHMEALLSEKRPYLDRYFSRIELASLAGIGRHRLNAILLQEKATNPANYINNLRLEYAAMLIREHPEYIISRIAENSGLPNISTFHRLFRERYGMTPVEYKKALYSTK